VLHCGSPPSPTRSLVFSTGLSVRSAVQR
jgi:hypothetical protein